MIEFSLITVVYNAGDVLQRTLDSIFKQIFTDYELIVIDGASTDNTLDLIKANKAKISCWISEKDNGIFDAMNKGINMASGRYVIFLNAGDEFLDEQVLNIVKSKTANEPDIVYSSTLILNVEGELKKHIQPGNDITWKSFRKGMIINHQSMFIHRDLVGEYNLTYKLAADLDWAINVFRRAEKIECINKPLIKYYLGGVSDTQIKNCQKETLLIIRREFKFVYYIVAKIRFIVYNLWCIVKNRLIR